MTDLRETLASNMKCWRKKRGLSQARLAERISTAANYISQVEAQKQFPSVAMLEKIAAALEIDTLELFSAKPMDGADISSLKLSLLHDIENLVDEYIQKIESRES